MKRLPNGFLVALKRTEKLSTTTFDVLPRFEKNKWQAVIYQNKNL